VAAHPRLETDLRRTLVGILANPAPDEDPKDLKAMRAAALRRLQAYRALCGVPWQELALDSGFNDLCQAASEVCNKLGQISHDPPDPGGLPPGRYQQGRLGAASSNLCCRSDIASTVDAYMADSDSSNIDRVGHRRWCLNPPMRRTGFGWHEGTSAMWSMDEGGPCVRGMDAVCYPPPGCVPVDIFGPRHAWSNSPLRFRSPKHANLKIRIVPLDDRYLPVGDPLVLDHATISEGEFASPTCIIFRPGKIKVAPKKRYWTEVSLDGGKTAVLRYLVEFVDGVGTTKDK
jgi:hypothetical protein